MRRYQKDQTTSRKGRSFIAKIYLAVASCLLFISQCVHMGCMTGVTCIPYFGPPEWLDGVGSGQSAEERDRDYEKSFNVLQKAVLANKDDLVEHAISVHPDQIEKKTVRGETALEIAIRMNNVGAIRLLIRAGADGFATRSGYYSGSLFEMALDSDSERLPDFVTDEQLKRVQVERSQTGYPNLLIEPWLENFKFDPKSSDAQEYLEAAASSTVVVDRLLSYGVPFQVTPRLAKAILWGRNTVLFQRALKSGNFTNWTAEMQFETIKAALSNCKFDMALALLDKGMKPSQPEEFLPVINRWCADQYQGRWDGLRGYGCQSEKLEKDMQLDARDEFLSRLARGGMQINAPLRESCPAWRSNDASLCQTPKEERLMRTYQALGAVDDVSTKQSPAATGTR